MPTLCGHWAVPLLAKGSDGCLQTSVPEAGEIPHQVRNEVIC